MEFKLGQISEKRCKELKEMGIECPSKFDYCNDGAFTPELQKFVFNEDETILLSWCFIPKPASRLCDFKDLYLFVVNKEYYLFEYEKGEDYKCEDGTIEDKSYFLLNKKINKFDPKMEIFKQTYIYFVKNFYKPIREYKSPYLIEVYYGGEKI